jgi:thiol-disulfide isomerase/thioredoxin
MIAAGRALLPAIVGTCLLAGCSSSEPEVSQPEPASEEIARARTDQLVRLAVSLGEAGRFDQAMNFLNDALRIEPTNRAAMFRTAQFSLFLGRQYESRDPSGARNLFLRAAEAARRLREVYPDLTDEERLGVALIRYAQTRVLTEDGKPEEAMATLKDALELGFDDPRALLTDPKLDPLRSREDFQQLAAQVEGDAQEQALKLARAALADFKPYPLSFELPDLEGRSVKLDDLRGKVTIVDIWGTWCGPCRVELPHFVDLYGKYRDRGLEVVGIAYEQVATPEEAAQKVREFVETEIKLPYHLVIGDGATMERLQPFEGFPTTLFLDASGQVRAKFVGAQPKLTLEAMVLALMEEPSEKSEAASESE